MMGDQGTGGVPKVGAGAGRTRSNGVVEIGTRSATNLSRQVSRARVGRRTGGTGARGAAGGAGWPDRYQQILDISRDAFLETDDQGVLTGWNSEAELMFGWPRSEVVGRRVVDFLIPERFAAAYMSDLAKSGGSASAAGRSYRRDLRLMRRDGSEVQVAGVAFVLDTPEGVRIGGFVHDLSGEKASEEALAHAYLHDSLTGLPNRTMFTYRLSYCLAQGKGVPGSVAVVVLDLDRFKAINDGLGHEVGDEVLVAVSERLVVADGAAEVIARLGGDEFLVLFGGEDALVKAVAFAERVKVEMSLPIMAAGAEVFVTASVGIACTTEVVSEATALLSNADTAMYQAKQRGGAGHEVFGDVMRVKVLERMSTEHSLHRALERSELRVFYQPVVEISGTRAIGVEALVRWQHPDQGLVAPDRFIPVAEESGLIVPIGAWVLHEACTQLKSWMAHRWGGPDSAMEVNLSARQIDHPEIVATVERILSETGVAPASLTLEITESALMGDAAGALDVLRALKDLGVTLAIDDFGTGYSSLSYLQRFPLDILKVDKSFVDALGVSAEGTEIVAAVVNLAHALGLRVIAEGVETEQQLFELQRLDCDLAQGYLFSRPVPASELVEKFSLRMGA